METLGQRVGPHSVIFCPAGEPHGIRNPGEVVAKYIVFEFHGNQTGLGADQTSTPHDNQSNKPPGKLRKLKARLRALLKEG